MYIFIHMYIYIPSRTEFIVMKTWFNSVPCCCISPITILWMAERDKKGVSECARACAGMCARASERDRERG